MRSLKKWHVFGYVLLLAATLSFGVTFIGCETTGKQTKQTNTGGGGASSQPSK